jgi:hypothetical protein
MFVSGPSILASLAASALIENQRRHRAQAGADRRPIPCPPWPDKSAKDEFMDYAKLTPAQKMRAAMLAKLGVTEEQLKAMSPEERRRSKTDQGA